jgi:hypothetical protein
MAFKFHWPVFSAWPVAKSPFAIGEENCYIRIMNNCWSLSQLLKYTLSDWLGYNDKHLTEDETRASEYGV